jgi:hypothetical protein
MWSILVRKKVVSPFLGCFNNLNGGHHLFLLIGAMSGGFYHFKEIMATKRDQETSMSKDKARLKKIKTIHKNPETNYKVVMYSRLKKFATTEQHKIFDDMILKIKENL